MESPSIEFARARRAFYEIALKHLVIFDEPDMDDTVQKLSVHFSFPNLTDDERKWILLLGKHRLRASAARNWKEPDEAFLKKYNVRRDTLLPLRNADFRAEIVREFDLEWAKLKASETFSKLTPFQEDLLQNWGLF